ncbi:MAG: MFS transporter [Planctomycetes bacterium]|nr:MFS transporter [Planctomycetota bacterium]
MPTDVAVLDDIAVEEIPRVGAPASEVLPSDFLPSKVSQDEVAEAQPSTLFYGWLMLPLAMLVMIATSPGQTFGLTFFNAKFRAAFDLSQTGLSVTYLLATVAASFALPTIGGWVDRFGLRRSALVAVTAMVAACIFASQVQGVVMLFFAFMLLRTVGPGSMTLLANNTLATWFDRRLGLVSGVMQVGMAGALALVPAGIVVLIDTFGWRGAFLAIAAIIACTLIPLLLFFYRQSPSEMGLLPDGDSAPRGEGLDWSSPDPAWGMDVKQARQHRAFWILLAAAATWALIGTGLMFHLEAIFQSRGMGVAESARALSCLAIGMGAMQILSGLLADRLSLHWLLGTAIGLMAVSCAMLATGQGGTLIVAYALYGAAQGIKTIVAATAWARYFGRAHLGKIRGISLTAAIAGSSVGPLAMGISADYLGGFTPALWLFTTMAVGVSLASFFATPPAVKRPVVG